MPELLENVAQALREDDAPRLRELLQRHGELRARINEPFADFDSPAITCARSREMLDVLLSAGADINARSRWWAGGFGLLHTAEPQLAEYAIERSAVVDVHAAARLGRMEKLRELVSANPELVHARGGDGQTPLHFANDLEVAEFLLARGADMEARDIDHESTPAQYMVRDRQDLLRYLVRRGCKTEILMAAALGDVDLAREHLNVDPDCVRMRVSDDYFPMTTPKAGGTIYQWTLGWHVSAHDVARQFGHQELLRLLLDRSPDAVRFLVAAWSGDEAAARPFLQGGTFNAARLSEAERRQIAHAARNNNTAAVRLMLAAGFPIDARGQHGGTPLHWAAWHGNLEMARELLRHKPPLDERDFDFKSTPVGWGIHGSENGWHRGAGEYAATLDALLQAGATVPDGGSGTDAVKEVLQRYA